jgi:cytochrome c556
MSRKFLALAFVASVAATVAGPAQAQFRDPQAGVKYRTATMTLLGNHFGRLAPVAKKEVPFDQAAVQANVDVITMLSDLPWAAYAKGYEGGEARGDIWTDNEGFEKSVNTFKVAVEQLDKASQAGDFDAFRVAFGQVGQSCKACHDSYRIKK